MTNELMNQMNSNYNNKLGSEKHNTVRNIETLNILTNIYPSILTKEVIIRNIPLTEEGLPDLKEYNVDNTGYTETITQVFTSNEIQNVQTQSMQKAA